MIYGNIEQIKDMNKLGAPMVKALDYLASTDFSTVEVGRYELDGDNLFALVQEMTTLPVEERKPESHELYVDIQYLVAGKEIIGVGVLNNAVEVKADMRPDKDVIFYGTPDNETMLKLQPGDFGIFYPTDIHRPGCINGEACDIKKVVIKILYSTL